MKITVTINSCSSCRHLDHSGAFTPGGAKSICGHPDAKGNSPPSRQRQHLSKDENHHWKWRVIQEEFLSKNQPDWCPLKLGFTY